MSIGNGDGPLGLGFLPRLRSTGTPDRAVEPTIQIKVTMEPWWSDAELDRGKPDPINVFSAFSRGDTWNGWATPHFTFHEAQRVVEAQNMALQRLRYKVRAKYDATRDAFIMADTGEDDETLEETYGPIHVRDGTIKLYAIGAYGWVWSEVE